MRKIICQNLFRRSFPVSIMAYRFFFIFKESDLSQLWEEWGHESLEMDIRGSWVSPASQSEKPCISTIEVMTWGALMKRSVGSCELLVPLTSLGLWWTALKVGKSCRTGNEEKLGQAGTHQTSLHLLVITADHSDFQRLSGHCLSSTLCISCRFLFRPD